MIKLITWLKSTVTIAWTVFHDVSSSNTAILDF